MYTLGVWSFSLDKLAGIPLFVICALVGLLLACTSFVLTLDFTCTSLFLSHTRVRLDSQDLGQPYRPLDVFDFTISMWNAECVLPFSSDSLFNGRKIKDQVLLNFQGLKCA